MLERVLHLHSVPILPCYTSEMGGTLQFPSSSGHPVWSENSNEEDGSD